MFQVNDKVKYDGNHFGTVTETADDMIGFTNAVQIISEYGNKMWFEAAYLELA